MTDGNPPQGLGEEEGPDLAARLSDMSPERLAEEVISVWEDARESGGSNRARVAELEESLRVADSRIAQMEVLLENERVRRADIEVGGEQGRFVELQDENARLLRSEEEHVMLILDMEAQLELLVSEVENLRRRSSQ